MFQASLEVMLYVEDVKASVAFWQAIGFVTAEIDANSAQIQPVADSQVKLMLYDKAFIRAISPEVVDNVPSILFQASDLEALHARIAVLVPVIGEIVEAPGVGRVFNFSDPDGQYFAVREVKSNKMN